MLQHYEGIIPNVYLDACTREQLQAAHPGRFFPCPDTDNHSTSQDPQQQQQQQQPDAEAIAGLQQGTAAWHRARSCHITGSQLSDLLGFSCPAPNRTLVKHQVYHRVPVTHAGYGKLLHCIGSLRGDAQGSTAAAPTMEPFGQLACTWGSQHEAAAHHTLLQHSPPGSLLIDTGFVSPAFDAQPEFYGSITTATPANRAIGSLGDIPLYSVRQLRLGCSLDGLLLTPAEPNNMHNSANRSSLMSEDFSLSGGFIRPGSAQQQQQQTLDPSSIRRAPPYTWATEAGYTVSCVEIKCPTPYWSVKDRPWAFACVGQDRNRPYQRIRAGHYCQSQLSMLVTGTECCVYVVWTRGRTWITHVPINRAWLHTCLHLLVEIQRRYVAPDAFSPPPANLFWEPAQLPDGDTQLSALYRRFIEATAVLSASISSKELPDPIYRVPWNVRQQQQQQQQQQQAVTDSLAQQQQQQQEIVSGSEPQQQEQEQQMLQGLEHLRIKSSSPPDTAAAAAAQQPTDAPAGAPAELERQPPPGWEQNSSGRPLAEWCVLASPQTGLASQAAEAAATASTRAELAQANGTVTAPAGAAAGAVGPLGWCSVYSCMVKSLLLPQALQHPLQQDRWFLDRLDPDSHIQSRLGVHQAWLDHPLLDSLPDHPQGVQVLLQRMHMSQPPMHLWTAAAGTVGAGAGYSGHGAGGGSAVAARGVSPGKLVLALLLKTEKLNGLDLSPVWKLLPQSALDVLEVWRAAAQQRAAAAAAVQSSGAGHAVSTPAAATPDPATASSPGGMSGQQPSHPLPQQQQQQQDYIPIHAAPMAEGNPTAASSQDTPQQSSNDCQPTVQSGPWAAAVASWRQRQHLRQQQLVAALRRCIGVPAARQIMPHRQCTTRHSPFQAANAQTGAKAGIAKPAASFRQHRRSQLNRRDGLSSTSLRSSSSSSSRLASGLRGLGLADLLQDADSITSAAAAAVAAAAVAAIGPVTPHAMQTYGAVGMNSGFEQPVVVAGLAVASPAADQQQRLQQQIDPQQQQQQQQWQSSQGASSLLASVAQPQQQQQQRQVRRGNVLPKQQRAQKLVASAQQQQRSARLARYQAAVRSWSLEDMLQEVSHLDVQQQPLPWPVHEVLKGILTAHQEAAELLQQAARDEVQQQQQQTVLGRLRPAGRQPVVAAAAAAAGPAGGGDCQGVQQQPQEQQQPVKKQKQPRQPRQQQQQQSGAPVERQGPASRSRLQHVRSKQQQQLDTVDGACTVPPAVQTVAADGEAVAKAAAAAAAVLAADANGSGTKQQGLAAIAVVAPNAVLAYAEQRQ